MDADPFVTRVLRDRVLAGWTASAARFREDANAEEDLTHGGYRDRVVVELAQNAADAAARAGVPGRLLLSLRDLDGESVLVASNTGAALDAEGVQALATLRASAKRGPQTSGVGRFGVGFAAVLTVTDEPAVLCLGGGVRFSRADTRDLVRQAATGAPSLGEELERRDGHVPVLRLPFGAQGRPPQSYDTAVVLPLRDTAARELLLTQLAEVGDALLLALPSLVEVRVEVPGEPARLVAGAQERWHVLTSTGTHPPEALTDRPTEERARRDWSLTWALPRGGNVTPAGVPAVVHAPTPTDEPLTLPAMLLATFPLDPSRRHVAEGPATDRLVQEVGEAYAQLLAGRARDGGDVLALVPTGLAGGLLDARVRAAAVDALRRTPVLPAAQDPTLLLRGSDAVALRGPAGADPDVLRALGPALSGLVRAGAGRDAALEVLGVQRLTLADVVDALPPVADPAYWRRTYDALVPVAADPAAREALGALPVPLADGRVVRGPRGLVLPSPGGSDPETLTCLAGYGLRVVHPQAASPLLERLGAVPGTARTLLEDPAVAVAVEDSLDADEPGADEPGADEAGAVAQAVLSLVAEAVHDGALRPGDLPVLGDLALPDGDGELSPASGLALPASMAARVLDPEEIGTVHPSLVQRWGAPVLQAVGVLDDLATVRGSDVPLDDPDDDVVAGLDGFPDWVQDVVRPAAEEAGLDLAPVLTELVAVADLDVVLAAAWPEVLAHLAADPERRGALVDPARVSDGQRSVEVLGYTAWWLRREAQVDGRRLEGTCDPHGDAALAELLDPAPEAVRRLDPAVRRALGVVSRLDELAGAPSRGTASAGGETGDRRTLELLLRRLADPGRTVTAASLLKVWARLARLHLPLELPSRVRVLQPGTPTGTAVVDADDAVVVDAPMWWQRTDLGGRVVAPAGAAEALADLLDLPLASEQAAGEVTGTGRSAPVPVQVRQVLPGCPGTWREHKELQVDGRPVDWWVQGSGPDALVHAATVDGLARGLAQAAGTWRRRALAAEVLAAPDRLVQLLAEDAVG